MDVNGHYPVATKQLLAKRMGNLYTGIMRADVNRV